MEVTSSVRTSGQGRVLNLDNNNDVMAKVLALSLYSIDSVILCSPPDHIAQHMRLQ